MGYSMVESSKHVLSKMQDSDDTANLFNYKSKKKEDDALDHFMTKAKEKNKEAKTSIIIPRSMSAQISVNQRRSLPRPVSDIKFNNLANSSQDLSNLNTVNDMEIYDDNPTENCEYNPTVLPPWVNELYSNRRDEAPLGARNMEMRNNSIQKSIAYEKKRDDYLHNHPDLAGFHMSKIDQKHVYMKNNPLINYFSRNLGYVENRKERIKRNEYGFQEVYSVAELKTQPTEYHRKFEMSKLNVDKTSGLVTKPYLERSFKFRKVVHPEVQETVNPKSWHSEVKDQFPKDNIPTPKIFKVKPGASFYGDIDKFEKSLKLHKHMSGTKHYAAVKYKDLAT